MEQRLEAVRAELETHGAASALAILNAGVPHRFTGAYRLRDGKLLNVELVDKQGLAAPADLLEVPLNDSFCQFVLRDGGFQSANTSDDQRLDGHPYQGVVLSYCGVPIADGSGQLWGTLCHFDLQGWHLGDDEYALLQRVARMLAPHYAAQRPAV